MERLTKRMDGISHVMCGNVIYAKCESCNHRVPSCYEEDCAVTIEALRRLASYEDTGLTPEDIANRCTVLPCKVGKRLSSSKTVEEINIKRDGVFLTICESYSGLGGSGLRHYREEAETALKGEADETN